MVGLSKEELDRGRMYQRIDELDLWQSVRHGRTVDPVINFVKN
jgi:hypothetical protein